MAAVRPAAIPPPPPKPVVPETWFDVVSQRTYILAVALALQSIKLFELGQHYFPYFGGSSLSWLLCKWSLVDALCIWLVPLLRIPRLTPAPGVRFRLIMVALVLNWLLMGKYKIPYPIPSRVRNFFHYEISISEHRVRVQDVVQPHQHLLGQHTVRLSPVSTAELNPQLLRYCFAPGQKSISIPVLVNNTNPHQVKFSIESLEDPSKIHYGNLDGHFLGSLALVHRYPSGMPEEEFGPERPQKAIESNHESQAQLQLEDAKGLVYIQVDRPGVVRLESILDSDDEEIRIVGGATTIPECPAVSFRVDSREPHSIRKCLGDTLEGTLEVKGVPPLTVQYWREINGKRESLHADGIDDDSKDATRGSQLIPVALPLDLPRVGSFSYGLTSVTDGLGNTVTASHLPTSSLSSFTVNVLSQPTVQWSSCSVDKPRNMAKGSRLNLPIVLSNGNVSDGPWEVQVQRLSPGGTPSKHPSRLSFDKMQTRNFEVSEPGDYTLLNVQGRLCDGIVREPEVCRVMVWPEPSLKVDFEPIMDKNCGVETGFMAHIVFQGTPPFEVTYAVKKDGRIVDTKKIPRIQSTLYDLRLESTQGPGSYQYALTEFGDQHYKQRTPLHKTSSISHAVHTIADAELVRPPQPIKLWSCSGNTVDVDVQLEGVPPWDIEFQLSSPQETKKIEHNGITQKQKQFTIPIPSDVDEFGGHFDIALVTVKDKKECRRTLSRQPIGVDVSRNKATARFTGVAAETRELQIIEGSSAKLPLRLTGDGPIKVLWENVEDGKPRWTTARGQNEELDVSRAGRYRLLEVVDAHGCPGHCEDQISIPISFIGRPSVCWAPSSGDQGSNLRLVRKPICEGVKDHVELQLSGIPMFAISGKHVSEDQDAQATYFNVSSPLRTSRIDLAASPPGKHIYTIDQLRDSNYIVQAPDIPALEQEVLEKPSASFKSDARLPYCLHDSFTRRKGFANADLVLRGQAPFEVVLSIKDSASSSRRTEIIRLDSNEWDVEFPNYAFDKIGPHVVQIESVKDANGCPQGPLESDLRSAFIDVAETAAILPMETRSDYCVGDTLQFQLEGTSPWTVVYDFNGRESKPNSKTAKFSRVAEKPGVFAVKSISHQNNLCLTKVDNVKAVIHELPSAIVSHGRSEVENIREGDQAEILFDFAGEPPFTFTFQRSEISKKGKPGRVLETHTVTSHMEKQYRFSSALEGTWTITFVADKYCRYPPVPPATVDGMVETI